MKKTINTLIPLTILMVGCSSGDVIKEIPLEYDYGENAQVNCTKRTIRNPDISNKFLDADGYTKAFLDSELNIFGFNYEDISGLISMGFSFTISDLCY